MIYGINAKFIVGTEERVDPDGVDLVVSLEDMQLCAFTLVNLDDADTFGAHDRAAASLLLRAANDRYQQHNSGCPYEF